MGKLVESETYSRIGSRVVNRGLGIGNKLLGLSDEAPPAPAPLEMPTADTETIRRARLREIRRMVAQNQGRESTILGGARKPLGAGKTPEGA